MIKSTTQIQTIKNALDNGHKILSALLEKRQEKYDNASERWLESDAGEDFSEDNDNLEILVTSLEEAITAFDDVFE